HCHNLAHEDLGMMQNIEVVRTPEELTPITLRPPCPAPAWKLADSGGRWHSSTNLRGRPAVLVFYQGGACAHCLKQLALLNEYAGIPEGSALRFAAIGPEPRAELAVTPK